MPVDERLLKKFVDTPTRMRALYSIVDERGQSVPFELNPIQMELLNGMHSANLILKSRQHGITTFFCLLALDCCIFKQNFRAGIIAHTREDAESFFRTKIKYAWDQFPDVLKKAMNLEAEVSSARVLAFSNNSSIRVGTSLRGATLDFLHISEFGKIAAHWPEKAHEIITGSLNTLHDGSMVAIESTAEGSSGKFHELATKARRDELEGRRLSRIDFKHWFFPWHRDAKCALSDIDAASTSIPERFGDYFAKIEQGGVTLTQNQRAWYVAKEALLGQAMWREFPSSPEEAFAASIEGAYFSRQIDSVYAENRITAIPYEEGLITCTAWDLGLNDQMAIWFFQLYGQSVRFIKYYENSGEGLAHYANYIRSLGWRIDKHFAPHDIEVKELTTGKSRLESARQFGLNFTPVKRLPKVDQIEAARSFFARCWFDSVNCEVGLKHLAAYRHEWDSVHGVWKDNPLHDEHSDCADAFMVAALSPEMGHISDEANKIAAYTAGVIRRRL